jgi:hypothetical protein
MVRIFDRNMFIMLSAIMVGVVIITYFVGDIVNRSKIETLTLEHATEITDLSSRNENFTDNFLQGSIKLDAAREKREVANYYFDLAMLWYNTALVEDNETQFTIYQQGVIDNCSIAITNYQITFQGFDDAWPYFEEAKSFTDRDKYLEVLGFYTAFAQSGKNLSLLRISSCTYLTQIAENLTVYSDLTIDENLTALISLFDESVTMYETELGAYEDLKGQIDDYIFFDEIREDH